MSDKEFFQAKYGSREHALSLINSDAAQNPHNPGYVSASVSAVQALKNPAVTDDDIRHIIENHKHPIVCNYANKEYYERGWKRKSILDPSWVKYK